MELRFILPATGGEKTPRDRFLVGAMGACWHEYDRGKPANVLSCGGYICAKCGSFVFSGYDFSTEEDFLKLLDWARNQEDLTEFTSRFAERDFLNERRGPAARKRFVDGLYVLLTETGRKKKNAQRQRA